jgi:Zn-dependent protease
MTEQAAAPAAEPEDPQLEQDFKDSMQILLHPPKVGSKTILLLTTLGLFVAASAARGGNTAVDIAILIGVLLVHELGHAVAMRAFGYKDVRIFFIPFLGAAASGRRIGVARWKQALVLLAGPVPGILAGCVLGFIGGPPWTNTLVLWLVIINGLNLLPVEPLDGGRLFQTLLYSRNRKLEIAIRGITSGAVLGFSLWFGQWMFAALGALMLFTLGHRNRILVEAERIKPLDLPSDPHALDDAQARTLHASVWTMLPAQYHQGWRGKAKAQAGIMEQVLDAASTRPPSGGATAGLLVAWFLALGIAFLGLVFVVPAQWQSYTHPTAGFTVDMPGPVEVTKPGGDMMMVSTKFRLAEYAVLWDAINTDEKGADRWFDFSQTALSKDGRIIRQPRAPDGERRFVILVSNGAEREVRLIAKDGVGYMLIAQPSDTEDAQRMLDSFKPPSAAPAKSTH